MVAKPPIFFPMLEELSFLESRLSCQVKGGWGMLLDFGRLPEGPSNDMMESPLDAIILLFLDPAAPPASEADLRWFGPGLLEEVLLGPR
jgi:hypothetical protein